MKNYDENVITLSIGDGGNDVPMKMEALIALGFMAKKIWARFKILRELFLFMEEWITKVIT